MTALEDIPTLFRAGYPAIVVNSDEETRVLRHLSRMAQEEDVTLWLCSVTDGIVELAENGEELEDRDPAGILDRIHDWDSEEDEWFVLLDFHHYLGNPSVLRRVRDILHRLHARPQKVIFLQPHFPVPRDLEREVTVLDLGLPGPELLGEELDRVVASSKEAISKLDEIRILEPSFPDKEQKERLVEAMAGMTVLEAGNALSRSFLENGGLDLGAVTGEKMAMVRKSGFLELYPSPGDLGRVGGHGILKEWLQVRRRAFGPEARAKGIRTPRGLVLVGPWGTGKSLVAKCVASEWGVPLVRLDVGRLFAGVVGHTERNVRSVIELCEALGSIVLWLDEMDKGFAMPSGRTLAGGEVTKHLVGEFTTWLQEKTCPVFVVATMNDVHSTPPELVRKGRFDEIFFVDLPDQGDRVEITNILLAKVGRQPGKFDCDKIAAEVGGFSGAEIEQAIYDAMIWAFHDGKKLTTKRIMKAAGDTMPMSVTMREEINELRRWAKNRARFSAKPWEDGA